MSGQGSPLKITDSDLHSSDVDSYVETQEWLAKESAGSDGSWVVRVIYANWFYLALACGSGGFLAWLALEPFIDDNEIGDGNVISGLLTFPAVVGSIGLFLGAAEGLMCRNITRALLCGTVGLVIGFVGGLITIIPVNILFTAVAVLAAVTSGNPEDPDAITGMALLILMMGRAIAWCIASIPAGIGQGIALREKKVIVNGLVGALLGGLLGGLLFDPISEVFLTEDGQASVSRAVGFTVIGCMVGLFVGLVEGWTKTAWLMMKKGPLAGKQFILFKDTTQLGSVPKADIYLFKDDAIEPRHAVIYNRGGTFEIEDGGTGEGTYVNGVPVTRRALRNGDEIVLGKTVLEFSLRENDRDG